MENKYYKFGNAVFRIESPLHMKSDSRFDEFSVNETEADFHYIISGGTDGSSVYTEKKGNKIYAEMNLAYLENTNISVFLSNAGAEKYITEKNAFVLHASYVYYKGGAILFSAPSETGKSTQASFWKEEKNSETVNEDRVIIYKNNGEYYAGGCWATGTSKICRNISSPIKAIVLLSQGRENKIEEIQGREKFMRILPQCSYDENNRQQTEKMIDMLSDVINNVKIISFAAVKDKSAVGFLEKYI